MALCAAAFKAFFQRYALIALHVLIRKIQQRAFIKRLAAPIVMHGHNVRNLGIAQVTQLLRPGESVIGLGTADIVQQRGSRQECAV